MDRTNEREEGEKRTWEGGRTQIWSHSINIHFQLRERSRLNLEEVDGLEEIRKWLRAIIPSVAAIHLSG